MNGKPSTFIDIYRGLRDAKFKDTDENSFDSDEYFTEEGDIRLDGDISEWALRHTIRTLVELLRLGINPHAAMWLYCGHDWSVDAGEMYDFFVVHNQKIVQETAHFSWTEPLVLKRNVDDKPIWRSHPHFDDALERYWYPRFYTETLTGQFMVLRPDEPILFHYDRPASPAGAAPQVHSGIQVATLLKMHRLLWIAVLLLGARTFPSVDLYFEIAAGVMEVSLLWLWWSTPKLFI